MAYKAITAKFDGKCKVCHLPIHAGDSIIWESLHKSTLHPACKPSAPIVAAKAKAPKPTAFKPVPAGYSAHYTAPNAGQTAMGIGAGSPLPATQKGKGIHVLQKAGILAKSMAYVCTTLTDAELAFNAVKASVGSGKIFARPCPITARHGFVDSRPVADLDAVRSLWAETKAADPLGELIIMPMVQAAHNCVWRPGLLAIGPGHDGATAGHDSITVFLQEAYAPAWADLAVKAGVNPETAAPFIESVSHDGLDTVVTQIRAGVKGAPTEPNWVPSPMTVGEVISIDGTAKADPDSMLAWEHTATTLKPGFHIVHDQGGNLGDHWSVHAQLNGIAVVTDFAPHVGQVLPKMGIDLAPLEPQAIIYGFLGGLLSPSLQANDDATRRKRERATVAAILGTHHGLRMGGDGGVHLGASVALFLRLGQAAVWGEARHAFSHASGASTATLPALTAVHGLSRQQIFSSVLDNWVKGRNGLRDVTRCFHLKWSSSYGGKAWAAIAHSVVALDKAMIELVNLPSRVNAKRVIAALTSAVNLAHNGVSQGCFLNKFAGPEWFDMAAGLDPRAALMAGPIWYEATLADTTDRIHLLEQIEKMEPINVGYEAPKGNVLGTSTHGHSQTVGTHGLIKAKAAEVGAHVAAPHVPYVSPSQVHGSKVGSFGPVELGSGLNAAGIDGAKACAFKLSGGALHTQIALASGGYVSGEVTIPSVLAEAVKAAVGQCETVQSFSGSGVTYYAATVLPTGIVVGKDALMVAMLTGLTAVV